MMIALVDEWTIRHNWTESWASVSIPHDDISDAVVYTVTDDGRTVVDTLPNRVARETVRHCLNREHEYTVSRGDLY